MTGRPGSGNRWKGNAGNIRRSIAVLLAFVSVGALTGWLVGASDTPVATALIPLVFGLIGAVGFGYAEAAAQLKSVRELLAGEIPDLKEHLTAVLGQDKSTTLHLPAFWSIGVIAFCVACFIGLKMGVELRVPQYASLSVLTGRQAVMTPQEASELHGFRLALRRQNLPPGDVNDIFQQVVAPF